MIAFWMGENNLIARIIEAENNVLVILIFSAHWELDEQVLAVGERRNGAAMQERRDVAINIDFVAEVDIDIKVALLDVLAKLAEELAIFGTGAFIRAAVYEVWRSDDVGNALAMQSAQNVEAILKSFSAIVDAWQDVGVDINHIIYVELLCG